MERLDKYLADAGIGTRSEVKRIIRKGLVRVGDEKITLPEHKVEPGADQVFVDGKPVAAKTFVYYMLHKPAGYLSATEDPKQPTVLELLEGVRRDGLFPVGRLDKDTEGLLLITDDGELSHRLLSPVRHVDKVYEVTTDVKIPEDAVERFAQGIDIGEKKICQPADLEVLDDTFARVTLREGKFHQVKRMFAAVGCKVEALRRVSFGGLELGDLPRGEFRELTEDELQHLRDEAGL